MFSLKLNGGKGAGMDFLLLDGYDSKAHAAP